jgi:hypothetical protein
MKTIRDIEDFRALDPFFRIIEQGLEGLVDGGHFFDLLAEDVVFEFIITVFPWDAYSSTTVEVARAVQQPIHLRHHAHRSQDLPLARLSRSPARDHLA